ncbi:pirin family protein [Pontibacter sp. SGAir0037]|uniref:pirin family protein n=1 Tax=Pontibacter sp. SGAir0037 TaxID=2571030 RepID=UPI0010CCCF41|nr:pirin family protein [Pontibacter sp. SGAir0037]QCR22083.1 pirin family protein [Pontibacter sp. SGAir0037]
MKHIIYTSEERGLKDLGWLQSNLTFSFSDYYHPTRRSFGLLRAFNDDFVAPENGFGLHAHANMEIISVMLAGAMNHIDNLGYKEVVQKDWVQIMSAGSGMRHEEHNVGDEQVNFLQIWIEPKLQNITPRYQKRYFPEEGRKNKLVTIVSNEEGQAHCWINQNAKLSLGYFEREQEVQYTLNPTNKSAFVFNISGSLLVNEEPLEQRDAIGIWDTDQVHIKCLTESRFLLIEVPINN